MCLRCRRSRRRSLKSKNSSSAKERSRSKRAQRISGEDELGKTKTIIIKMKHRNKEGSRSHIISGMTPARVLLSSPSHSPMEKLRETVNKLASTDLNEPLSASQISLIDQCLHESFALGLQAPSHPPYSSMIMTAITELNRAEGLSEDSICEYIKAKFDGLPWAYQSILRHHLNRLCDQGLILLIASDRYTIPAFTPKRVYTRVKVKGKQIVKRRVICPVNLEVNGVQLQGSLSGKGDPKVVSHENKEFVRLESGNGIEDEDVTNECSLCRSLVVVEVKEEKKDQEEDQETEVFGKGEELNKQNSLITKLTVPEIVKFHRRKNRTKRDQLLTEEESLEDYSSGDEWMDNGASVEILVTKKKKVVNPVVDRVIVYALGTKLHHPTESVRRVARQSKKLTISPVSKSPGPKLLTEEESLEDYSSGDEWTKNGASVEKPVTKKKKVVNPVVDRVIVYALGTKLHSPAESVRHVARQSKKLTISPVSKSPSPKLQKHEVSSILSGQETKSNWPSWVPSLLKTDFYVNCQIHANVEKSICNMYCSDCKDGALCTSCVTSHEGHHVIKIKQADFEQLVDVSDIDKYVDIKDIRTIKESSTVTAIVLKSVATWKGAAKNNSTCLYCKSRVPFPNKFCTLSCKFEHEHKVG